MNNIDNIYSLSPLQQGLLFHQHYEPASRAYHQQLSLRLDGTLDAAAFRQAWRALMARHAVLRTSFLWEDLDDAYQVVHRELDLPLLELDWRGTPTPQDALRSLEQEQRAAAFAFDDAPLMRLCLVRLAEQQWQMVWTYHHILLDGWSVGIVLRDWLALYRAQAAGGAATLPPLRAYADYIGWLDEQDGEAAERFWRQRLHDFADPTPLPGFLPRREIPAGPPCAEQQLLLETGESAALAAFARGRHLTLNTLVQGAWALLLGAHAGRDEVLFGVTSGGRPAGLAGVDDMAGLFINTLPLRTGWGDRPLLADWLRAIQDANIEQRQYEFTPVSRLRGYSAVASERALFDAILVFENFPIDAALSGDGADGLRFSTAEHAADGGVRLTQGRNNYPLSLIVAPGERLELTLCYARARLGDGEVAALLAQLRALLLAMPAHADAPVQAMAWPVDAEQRQLRDWGRGAHVAVPALCLHQLFERHADLVPGQTAVASPAETLSYGELERQANRLAHHFIGLGVQPGQVVAIALGRSPRFVVAMLAALKAGACYLPLDVAQPPARLAAMLADSGAVCLACDLNWQHDSAVPLVRVDGEAPWPQPDSRPAPAGLTARHAAYLIYTSGSTGQPKGAVLEHHAIVDYTTGVLNALQLPPASRFAMLSTVAADLGHTQLFGALCGGGTLVLVDDDTAFQPAALAAFLRAQEVDILKLTPSHLRGLLAAHGDAGLLPRHTLVLGGESVDPGLLEQVQALAPALRVFNHYGPTETAVGAVLNRLDGRRFDGPAPLGKPQPNRRLYVLDEHQRPVGLGVPGELYIGGGAIARCYLGHPELSAERFLPDTIANDGQRMYRTGDRVCWLASGELRFLGRVDSQVKIRGYRVELGEVEALASRLSPRITRVLARLAEVPGQGQRLLAYVVADGALSPDKLRGDMALLAPEYMVPAHFIQLDAIPLNANGKPDVRRLPPPSQGAAAQRGITAPRTALESTLAAIWQAVLKNDAIGVDDNFFELGGDSILSLQIIARANQQGIRITPKDLFTHRTIARLSAHLSHGADAPAAGADAAVPLSAGQRARIAGNRLGTQWRCLRLERDCGIAQVQAALDALVGRHGALRLCVSGQDGAWRQQVAGTASAMVDSVRLPPGTLDLADARARLAGLAPAAPDGLRATLLHAGGDSAILLSAPALMLDAASWHTVLRDFSLALSQARFGRDIALPATGADFAAFALRQNALAGGDGLDAAWEHWLEQAEVDTRTFEDAATVDCASFTLEREQSAGLRRLARRLGTDMGTLLAAALALEFSPPPGGGAIAVELECGSVAGGVGCFSHGAPFYLRSDAGGALQQLLAMIGQLQAGAKAGEEYGLLRHLSDNSYLLDALLALPRPQLCLAWRGARDAHCEAHGVLGAMLADSDDDAHGTHALHIAAWLAGGSLTLECRGMLAGQGAALLARLEALAQLAAQAPVMRAGVGAAALPLDWDRVEDIYPLSPTQHGMLLHTLLEPESGVYLVQQRFRWDGPLDAPALESAWRTLLQRHPVLRTRFWWRDGQPPQQYVLRDADQSLAWDDWRALAPPVQQQRLAAELAAQSRRGMDLAHGPLNLLRVVRLDQQRYELVRSYHHILSDGWSFGRVMEELLHLYRAAHRDEPAALPPAPAYRAYIDWLARQPADAARAFWCQELAGFNTPCALPLTRAAHAAAAQECVELETLLSVAHSARLEQLCRELQLTPNTWVQGAWALLLARYCGTRDVLFGVTVAGRPAALAGAGDMVGLFINTLPLRVPVPERQPVAAWLHELMARNIAMREHEHAALAEIQRWSEVEPGVALFDSLLVFENAPFGASADGLDAAIDTLHDRSPTNYPLTVTAMPGQRLGLRIAYQDSRFERPAMERLLGHFAHLLVQMLERPQDALGQLDMLAPPEHLQLDAWNRSEHDFPLERDYAALFAARVASHPDRTAARCGDAGLSYAQLDLRATRIARALRERGAGRDTIVAVLAERGLDFLAMMIGVLKAGAAFQPLDVNHPPQRLGELLALSGTPLLLAAGSGLRLADAILPALASAPACLDAAAIASHGDGAPLAPAGTPDSLAYVVFTSGSTGTPKGAMVEQRGMLNNIYGKLPAIGLGDGDRLAQTASPAFDISVWQFLGAPLLGGAVHILPDAVAHDPERLAMAVDAQGITLLELVPAQIRALLDAAPAGASLASLRWLMSIGEALPPELCRRWFARFPSVPLMNLYGPAECADNIACHALQAAPGDEVVHLPVGHPTANNQLYVLDGALRRVPVGVPGEICAAGAGVGRGYLNDEERTRAAFPAHPFAPGARFYRTGDLGRYRADGAIEFLGRRDQQVKVQGHRIELGEIESRLLQHPSVAAAAVLALPAADGGRRLAGFWQTKPGLHADADGLRRHLGAMLPAYMVPQQLEQLEALPLNANGKIDRTRLAQRAPAASAGKRTAPRNPTEAGLAEIWRHVLRADGFGMEDSFFALGGHSLLATQVVARIRAAFGSELPLRALFDHPTIAALAAQLEREPAPAAVLPPIGAAGRDAALPLSFAQQRLWFLEQLAPGGGALNIPFALRLLGEPDAEALRGGFELLLRRHEVLRTAFEEADGRPRLRIVPAMPFALPFEDCRGMAPPELARQLRDRAQRAFDLRRPPLLRAELLRTGDGEYVLLVVLHHIVADGWSFAVLAEELSAAYRALRHGAPPQLPAMGLQYADFAHWQRQHLPGALWQQQLAYWRRQLDGSPAPLLLPGALGGAAPRRPARHRGALPAGLAQALSHLALRHEASLFMVLHAALNVLLHQQTGRDDLLLGTDVANRHHAQTETMVGFFVNQLVLRCRLNGAQGFGELLADCRRLALEAFQHQDLPFDALVADLLPRRGAGQSPLFQVKLVLQNTRQQALELDGLVLEELALDAHAAELDLLVNVIPEGDGYAISYDYDAARYDGATIAQFDALYLALLRMVADDSEQSVNTLASRLAERQQAARDAALADLHHAAQAPRPALGSVRRKAVSI